VYSLAAIVDMSDLRQPHEWYTLARSMKRKIIIQ
jgi:hypothetical protein